MKIQVQCTCKVKTIHYVHKKIRVLVKVTTSHYTLKKMQVNSFGHNRTG